MDMVKSVKLDEALGLHDLHGSQARLSSLSSKARCQSDADSLAMPMAHANLATKFGNQSVQSLLTDGGNALHALTSQYYAPNKTMVSWCFIGNVRTNGISIFSGISMRVWRGTTADYQKLVQNLRLPLGCICIARLPMLKTYTCPCLSAINILIILYSMEVFNQDQYDKTKT